MPDLINPLQDLINQAAKIPATGELDKYTERLNSNPNAPSILLLDTSNSMSETTNNGRQKIDILREALNRPLEVEEIPFVFNSICYQIASLQNIPEPSGGTALHSAIIQASTLKPRHTLIVSDGTPDCKKQALSAAKRLSGIISTLFIGNDNDEYAIAFMSKLARIGCGKSTVCDIQKVTNQPKLKAAIAALMPNTN